jgi:hypothetical protein
MRAAERHSATLRLVKLAKSSKMENSKPITRF